MKIAYICNCQKKCCKSVGCIANGGECSHTCDIKYAKNYDETPIITEDSNFINLSDDFKEARYFEEEK